MTRTAPTASPSQAAETGEPAMRLHTLGTGGPRPDPERNASCYVLEAAGRYLMIDVGRGAIQGVARKGLPFVAIDTLLVTHHHIDHIGELANYLITSWLAGRRAPLRIFGPPGTRAIVDTLMASVYARDVAFRTEGETAFGPFIGAEVYEIRAGTVFADHGLRVSCEEVEHGHGLPFGTDFLEEWICLAYRIEAGGKSFSFSGDSVHCEGLLRVAANSDLHLQCCYLAASELTIPHLRGVGRYTLACSDTVGKIAAAARVRRLVLTHFRQTTPALIAAMGADIAKDYSGRVEFAKDLDQFDI